MKLERKKTIKFMTLYNSFTSNEKIDFNKFIGNVQNNSKRNYNKLLSSIKTDDNGITDFSQTNNRRTRWNRLSELSILADKFLTLKSLESDRLENRYLLLREYDRRNLILPFEHNFKLLKDDLTNQPIVNYDYNIVFHLEKIYLNHLKSNSDSKKYAPKILETGYYRIGILFIEILEYLIESWSIRNAGLLNSKTGVEEISADINFEKMILHFSEKSKSPDKVYHLIRFLYHIYKSLNDPTNKEHYIKAKRIFFKDLRDISKEKREHFYVYLLNYNIQLKNLSVAGTDDELFFLINRKLKEDLVLDFKVKNFPLNQFRDYILIALSLKKYRWTNNFINKYESLLPPDIREDTVSMGKAMLLFDRKDFLMCNELLTKIKRKNPFTFVDVYILKLKVLYELKHFDDCHNELKKFNNYLRKERISMNHLINYSKEFCKAYSLLLKLNDEPVNDNLFNLQYLLSKKILIGKKWITLKMEEIKHDKFRK